MEKIIIFAGTSEGRKLAGELLCRGWDILICVASEYGKETLSGLSGCRIRTGRMNAEEMEALIRTETDSNAALPVIVDATHPYAVEAGRNIRLACSRTGAEYLRLLRPSGSSLKGEDPDIIPVGSIKEAADYLSGHEGNALIATGSKDLLSFREVPDYRSRLTVRVLPSVESISACREAGFDGKHIIAMQGPFSAAMNELMLKETGARYLVTKESGQPGGLQEKLDAAKRAGVKVILVGRPGEEEGFSLEEVLDRFRKKDGKERIRKVYLVGCGMGNPALLTREAELAIRSSDVVIGSSRLLKSLSPEGKPVFSSYKAAEIRAHLDSRPEYGTAAVLFSGDIGFYSGARLLLEELKSSGAAYQAVPLTGISSLQYFCGKCGIPWEDVRLVSAHGRDANLAGAIRRSRRVFLLAGDRKSLSGLLSALCEYGFGHIPVKVGVNLSLEDERIYADTVAGMKEHTPEGLTVILFENDSAKDFTVVHGIPDNRFLRGDIPMTKEEVRSVVLSKLRLTRDAIVYDIGAGTGSVAVEAAIQSFEGHVYAVERKMEAACLIGENARRFGVTNLTVITGEAPAALDPLPVPTHAFIGGSGGRFEEICDLLLLKNPQVRIVATAVSLEGISAVTEYLKNRKEKLTDVEITQITVAKSREAGAYHLMTGSNPVLIAAFIGMNL